MRKWPDGEHRAMRSPASAPDSAALTLKALSHHKTDTHKKERSSAELRDSDANFLIQ